jgi:hypothetical protein
MIIVDCNWNMNGPLITSNAAPLVKYLRANGHANTPIVLAEGTPAGGEWLLKGTAASMQSKRDALRKAYEGLQAAGDSNLHYVNSSQLFPPPYNRHENPTVAGCHPTDLGMELVARFYTGFIPKVLGA